MQPDARVSRRNRPAIVVGSANFAESVTVAELYAHALADAGFPVERRLGIGNRDTYFPLLRDAAVGLVPEYVGSLLAYLDGAGARSRMRAKPMGCSPGRCRERASSRCSRRRPRTKRHRPDRRDRGALRPDQDQ